MAKYKIQTWKQLMAEYEIAYLKAVANGNCTSIALYATLRDIAQNHITESVLEMMEDKDERT
jgi:hypothetical protein